MIVFFFWLISLTITKTSCIHFAVKIRFWFFLWLVDTQLYIYTYIHISFYACMCILPIIIVIVNQSTPILFTSMEMKIDSTFWLLWILFDERDNAGFFLIYWLHFLPLYTPRLNSVVIDSCFIFVEPAYCSHLECSRFYASSSAFAFFMIGMLAGIRWQVIVVLTHVSMMSSDTIFYMCLLIIYSSSKKYPFRFFTCFWTGWFFLWCLWEFGVFYIFWIIFFVRWTAPK